MTFGDLPAGNLRRIMLMMKLSPVQLLALRWVGLLVAFLSFGVCSNEWPLPTGVVALVALLAALMWRQAHRRP